MSFVHVRQWLRVFGIGLCILTGLAGISKLFAANTSEFSAVVTKVVDGDTIHINDNAGKRIKVRMLGIDTPETHFQNAEGNVVSQTPWGEEAAKRLEKLIPPGTQVVVRIVGEDTHHRALATVFLNGNDVNLAMVKMGWAIPYLICDGQDCEQRHLSQKYAEAYLHACDAARQQEAGVFDPSNPLEEMPFEFRLRHGKRNADKLVGDIGSRRLVEPSQYRKIDVCKRIFFWREEDAFRLGFKYSAN